MWDRTPCRESPAGSTNFSAALEEIKNARVFGGIHFRTACVDGTALGISVGDYVMAHALLPTGGGGR